MHRLAGAKVHEWSWPEGPRSGAFWRFWVRPQALKPWFPTNRAGEGRCDCAQRRSAPTGQAQQATTAIKFESGAAGRVTLSAKRARCESISGMRLR